MTDTDASPSPTDGASDQNAAAKASVHGATIREIEVQDYIGRELRTLYDHVLEEEIPESLLRLIRDLQLQQTQKP